MMCDAALCDTLWSHCDLGRTKVTVCVRRAQEARLQSLAMQLAESDCTLRVTNTHLCSADSARAKEK